MNKKIVSIITAIMLLTMIPVCSFGAENAGSHNAVIKQQKEIKIEGKYTGPAPVFPEAISQKAIQLACPYGTPNSRMTYPNAKAKVEYQEALQNAYGDRKGWSKQTKAGASCDVFVGTVIRSCGYDREFPRALAKDLDYLPASKKFKKVGITRASQFKPGDIIMYLNKGHGGHICVYVEIAGKGYIAEASYTYKRYGRIARRAPDWTPSNFASFGVYRPVNKCIGAIQRGDYSTGVKNLQMFLNWAGFDCGAADGDFGKKTEAAVKQFQESQNIEVDGKFGSGSYAAALKYASGWPSSPKQAAGSNSTVYDSSQKTGSHYSGKWPTKVIKYKKGSKKNVKRWQAFLKWYGYSIKVDGDFGKNTRKLTKRFQAKYKLTADGVVGKNTINKAKMIKK